MEAVRTTGLMLMISRSEEEEDAVLVTSGLVRMTGRGVLNAGGSVVVVVVVDEAVTVAVVSMLINVGSPLTPLLPIPQRRIVFFGRK